MSIKPLNVLSLCDGGAIGRLALERAGIPVARYYASEIDKFAVSVAKKNWPDIIHVGNIKNIRGADLPKIDLVLAGPPCQDLSIAGHRLGLNGARSSLFLEVVRLIEETKPRYFLVENVVPANKQDAVIISQTLGVEPVKIDSALVSAQRRVRYYWTNIPGTEPTLFGFKIPQPKDRGIVLQDVLEQGVASLVKSYCIDANYSKGGRFGERQSGNRMIVFEPLFVPEATAQGYVKVESGQGVDLSFPKSKTRRGRLMDLKINCLTAAEPAYYQYCGKSIRLGTIKGKNQQQNRVYSVRGKSVTIKGGGGGAGANTGLYAVPPDLSCEPNRPKDGVLFNNLSGGGGLVETPFSQAVNVEDGDYIIRMLTPEECERLQTWPTGYTDCVTKTQRYKIIGNGWTAEVIVYLFGFLRMVLNRKTKKEKK